jgi:hypothetical protein
LLEGVNESSWLSFDASTGLMVGVPTNADVGYAELRLTAVRQRPDADPNEEIPDSDYSEQVWFTILVQADHRENPNPVFTVELLSISGGGNAGAAGARFRRQETPVATASDEALVSVAGLTADGTECFNGESRAKFVRAVASLLETEHTAINLISVAADGYLPACRVVAKVSDNQGLNCTEAANRATELSQPPAEARALWEGALVAQNSELVIETVAGLSAPCMGGGDVELSAVLPPSDTKAVMFISTLVGALVLLLAIMLAVFFRRRALKAAKGIDPTFAPRRLIALNEERRAPDDEFRGADNIALATDFSPRPAPYHNAPYFKDAPRYRAPPSYVQAPPQYKMPPAYPHDTSKIGADYLGLLSEAEQPDDIITTTTITTTTTIEEYCPDELDKSRPSSPRGQPPAFVSPPSYKDAGSEEFSDDEVFSSSGRDATDADVSSWHSAASDGAHSWTQEPTVGTTAVGAAVISTATLKMRRSISDHYQDGGGVVGVGQTRADIQFARRATQVVGTQDGGQARTDSRKALFGAASALQRDVDAAVSGAGASGGQPGPTTTPRARLFDAARAMATEVNTVVVDTAGGVGAPYDVAAASSGAIYSSAGSSTQYELASRPGDAEDA